MEAMPTTLLCAMKTRVNGYFYVPKLGPFLGGATGPPASMKIELLFSDSGIEGDQTGGTSPYPQLTTWPDGRVDAKDLGFVSAKYGTVEGHANWDYMADIAADKVCDSKDNAIVNRNYGKVGSYITDLADVTVTFDTGEVYAPNAEGFVNIPSAANSFYVYKAGVAIGAMVTFWKEPAVTYTLTLNVDKTSGYLGDVFTFTGTLTQNGTPVSGATVTLYKDDVALSPPTVTDEYGNYSFQWTADTAGNHSFYTVAVW
ncbi:MAG: Ig-like domain-containing protein [Candidatus Bathyarchaeia archaeon]